MNQQGSVSILAHTYSKLNNPSTHAHTFTITPPVGRADWQTSPPQLGSVFVQRCCCLATRHSSCWYWERREETHLSTQASCSTLTSTWKSLHTASQNTDFTSLARKQRCMICLQYKVSSIFFQLFWYELHPQDDMQIVW